MSLLLSCINFDRNMKVLMVCLGNICRSPLAHGVLQQKITEQELGWQVDSAGTGAYHAGELPDPRSIEVARVHGIDITSQRARQFVVKDFDNYDSIIAMDASNYRHITDMARNGADEAKVSMLLNYSYPDENRQVPDPYYGGGFDKVFLMVEQAVEDFITSHTSAKI